MAPSIKELLIINLVGSIGGAIIGALLGSFGTNIINRQAETRFTHHEGEKAEARRIMLYSRSIYRAEVNLKAIAIPFLLKDVRLLEQIADVKNDGNFMMTLPVTVKLDESIAMHFRNQEITNRWLTACSRVEMTNQLINDFKSYYVRTANEIHTMILSGKQPDPKTAHEDIHTLHNFAGDVCKGVKDVIKALIELAALVNIHAENINDKELAPKTMKDINSYVVPKDRYEAALVSLHNEFNAKTIFDDLNGRAQVK